MTKTPTVLVLGAGSSKHLHYPLGRELVNTILQDKSTNKYLTNHVHPDIITSFYKKLSRSDPPSIDSLLGLYGGYKEIGKFLIAKALKSIEDVDKLFPPHDPGWYRQLFEYAFDSDNGFRDSNIKIVTFNYDRSLEAYIYWRLVDGFDMHPPVAREMMTHLPIEHVHGILGAFPEVEYGPVKNLDTLWSIAESIQVISEIEDVSFGFCSQSFEKANTYIKEAERVFFMGFGFHEDNMRRLGFVDSSLASKKTIIAACGDIGLIAKDNLKRRLEPFGFPRNEWLLTYECNLLFNYGASLYTS